MKINVEGLDRHLAGSLLPVYLVTGDELLLVQESVDRIRRKAKDSGYTERSVFHVEGRFDWAAFSDECSALSLFAEKKVIELRFRKTAASRGFKLPKDAAKHLQNYLSNPSEDNILIIETPKLDGSEQRQKWCQSVDRLGVILTIWPVDLGHFHDWILKRAQSKGLKFSEDACHYLTEKVEGNLLAAAQEIDKLQFLSSGQPITLDTVMDSVAESCRYRTFDLADACLRRDLKHALHILGGLLAEGIQPTLILGILTRLIHQSIKISSQIQSGTAPDQACYKAGVTNKKQQGIYLNFSRNLPQNKANLLLEISLKTDRAIKGSLREDPVLHLHQLLQTACL